MKKLFLTLTLGLFFHTGFTQNWSLVMPNDTLVYEQNDPEVHLYTVWVDSISQFSNQTRYYMNQISPGKVVDTIPYDSSCAYVSWYPPSQVYIRELTQPQMVGLWMSDSSGHWTISYGDQKILINTNAHVGDFWLCDSLQNDTMQMIANENRFVDLFQVFDSVKVFEVNGLELVLSKNYGLLNAIDFSKDYYRKYELIGVHNLKVGQSIPMGVDYFDYNVGDKFVRWVGWYDSDGPNINIYKRTVQSKQIVNDTVIYDYGNKKIKYSPTMNPMLNAFPNTMAEAVPFFLDTGLYDSGIIVNVKMYNDYDGDLVKGNENSFDNGYGYCLMNNKWVEVKITGPFCEYALGIEPKIESILTGFYSHADELVGYIKDGVPHGDTTSVSELETEKYFKVFPNPVSSKLHITTEKFKDLLSYEVTNLHGDLVKSNTFQFAVELQVNGLAKGFYIVIIRNNNGEVLLRKKVVVL
ncbi:MAG: T9SS type A sorting domain-containing protein [Salibacteraceae bacterium]